MPIPLQALETTVTDRELEAECATGWTEERGWGGVGGVSSEECTNVPTMHMHCIHSNTIYTINLNICHLYSSQLENLRSLAILGVHHVKDLEPIDTPTPTHTYTNGYSHPPPHTHPDIDAYLCSYLAESPSVETQQ